MPLSYEAAGVGIDRGNAWIDVIKRIVCSGKRDPRVVGGIGGFSGLFRIGDDLLLSACCDGVGTKVELAREAGIFRGLGQDLVAMNVNDLVTCGATPLFFLDYLACGRLDTERYADVVEGIVAACAESDCVLLGGETAEMPGVYPPGGLDLAGFAVGMVRTADVVDGSRVRPGDVLVGVPSSGVHSNGFTLVRKVLADGGFSLEDRPEMLGESLKDALLRPTRLYVRTALAACRTGTVKAMAHITGGGLEENIVRVLGNNRPSVRYDSWRRPPIFDFLRERGVEEGEMRRVFNLGIGFVFVVASSDVSALLAALEALGEKGIAIGEVVS